MDRDLLYTRFVPRFALLALFLLASPALAAAQGAIVITVAEVRQGTTVIRDSNSANLANNPLGQAECADASNVEIDVQISNAPAGMMSFDVWLGSDTTTGTGGEDCSLTASRLMQTRICDSLGLVSGLGANSILTFNLSLLADSSNVCTETGALDGQLLRLYFLATGTAETQTDITPDQYGYVQIRIDPTPPTAPAPRDDTLTGDTGVQVSWTAITDPNQLVVNFYGDTSVGPGCTGADGGSTTLIPGDPPPDTEPQIANAARGATSATISASQFGIAEGQSVLIAMTSEDLAGNESVLSETFCFTNVPSAGFCELYGGCPQGCSCGVAGMPARRVALPVLFGVFLTLALVRRRRRSS